MIRQRRNQRMQRTIFANLRRVLSSYANGEQQIFIVAITSAKFPNSEPQRVNGGQFGGQLGNLAGGVHCHANADDGATAGEWL